MGKISVEEALDRELIKYMRVNGAETPEDLYDCIKRIAVNNEITGRNRIFNAERMITSTRNFFENNGSPNYITRNYGLRQQAIYIKYYMDKHPFNNILNKNNER